MLQKDMTPFSPDFLKSRLSLDPPPPEPPPGLQPAGVLAPVFFVDTTPHLLFTKRTLTVRDHRGQISFPGGVRSSKDPHLLATALRETEEEIGVDRNVIEVWGRINQSHTLGSGYWISPFVGLVPYPYEFKPNNVEVERLIIVPFSHLLDPANFSEGTYDWGGQTWMTQLYTYGDDVIWGLTARLLYNFLTLLTSGQEPGDF